MYIYHYHHYHCQSGHNRILVVANYFFVGIPYILGDDDCDGDDGDDDDDGEGVDFVLGLVLDCEYGDALLEFEGLVRLRHFLCCCCSFSNLVAGD